MADRGTGKYLSEALILALTNPQYDDRLFIALRVQYMNIPNPEHVVYINCSDCQNKKTNNSCTRTQHVLNICKSKLRFISD